MDPSFYLAFIAGSITTLSPCVLPVLPFVLGSAASKNKFGPVLICFGLLVTFVAIGWGIAAAGIAAGDSGVLRVFSAILFIILGLSLSAASFSERFSLFLGPLANWAQKKIDSLDPSNSFAFIGFGALLGAVWSPCSGPTLGAAALLASQSDGRWISFIIMLSFGIGATLPLLLISYGSRQMFRRHQSSIFKNSEKLKKLVGIGMIVLGIVILGGWDKTFESFITQILPDFWIDFTTRY